MSAESIETRLTRLEVELRGFRELVAEKFISRDEAVRMTAEVGREHAAKIETMRIEFLEHERKFFTRPEHDKFSEGISALRQADTTQRSRNMWTVVGLAITFAVSLLVLMISHILQVSH